MLFRSGHSTAGYFILLVTLLLVTLQLVSLLLVTLLLVSLLSSRCMPIGYCAGVVKRLCCAQCTLTTQNYALLNHDLLRVFHASVGTKASAT